MAVSQEWEIQPDLAGNPPFNIVPASVNSRTTTDCLTSRVVSIRVYGDDWEWFKNECRGNGTSTCREIRKWIHLAKEEAEFPPNLRRRPGPGAQLTSYVR